jgi:hypothetical protein
MNFFMFMLWRASWGMHQEYKLMRLRAACGRNVLIWLAPWPSIRNIFFIKLASAANAAGMFAQTLLHLVRQGFPWTPF